MRSLTNYRPKTVRPLQAGILQPPFFSASFPSFMSYASFGAVAAHELAHAFDTYVLYSPCPCSCPIDTSLLLPTYGPHPINSFSTGSKFDNEGFYRNWWSNVRPDPPRPRCARSSLTDSSLRLFVLFRRPSRRSRSVPTA